MTVTALSLPVVLPEAILALGALALVLFGALRGERSRLAGDRNRRRAARRRAGRRLLADHGQGRRPSTAPSSTIAFSRFMKALALIGSLVTLLLSLDFMRTREDRRLRVSGADPAGDARHDDADLGQRSHRALSRPRTDEPGALRPRRLSPRRHARDRSGPEIFRPRRAVVGHAALRRLADLRLRRHGVVHRHRRGGPRPRAASASSSASSSCWPASPSRFPPCRSTCGRPTSTRARRRR